MCGIVGLALAANHPNAERVVNSMADRIRHRGPDSGGYLATSNGLAHVGFRRLAIRDLDGRANQPMISASGRTAIVFNGEVYNSSELADRYLPDLPRRTSGDTEVVLETIERRGLGVLPELNGMFAMALVDLESGEITLARDRMGKKPLYVYQQSGLLAFASELRSLKPFGLRCDPTHIGLYFHFGYFPSPYTFFENTVQIRPGEVVQVRSGEVKFRQSFHRFTDQPWEQNNTSLADLHALFADSVRLRKLSDVPLGAFLSGGIDSALTAAYLRCPDEDPTPTFTVAFRDRAHNESAEAAETAAELSLPHQTIEIAEQNLADLAMDFQDCYEQPYADTSGLVTMLLCRAVKQRVTVALAGDGGDEFFGGYARYSWFRKSLVAQQLPGFARGMAAAGISLLDAKRGRRLARWLTADDPASLYAEILRNWNATSISDVVEPSLLGGAASVTPHDLVRCVFDQVQGDPLSKASCFDATYYIPDDLQVKLDRASMRVALEVRCPLLDFRIANAGLSMTMQQKYRDGLKSPLKRLLAQHVSPRVLNRPKHGFNVPLAQWITGPIKDLVADTLRQQVVRETAWLNTTTMDRVWRGFLTGKQQYAHGVWMLFVLAHHLQATQTEPLFASLQRRSGQQSTAA